MQRRHSQSVVGSRRSFQKNSMQSLQKATEFYFVQLFVPSPNKFRGKLQRGCYTLQPTCNCFRNAIATQVVKKVAVELKSTLCNDCGDLLKPLHVSTQDCLV